VWLEPIFLPFLFLLVWSWPGLAWLGLFGLGGSGWSWLALAGLFLVWSGLAWLALPGSSWLWLGVSGCLPLERGKEELNPGLLDLQTHTIPLDYRGS
jgi:hypothetical protein